MTVISPGTYELADAIGRTLARQSGTDCVSYGEGWWSWGEVATIAARVPQILDDAAVEDGYAVGLVLRNRPIDYAALLGLIVARRTVVLISPFQVKEAMAADLARLTLAAVFAAREHWGEEMIAAAKSCGTAGIAMDDDRGVLAPVMGLSARSSGFCHAVMPDVAIQMLTSGTTGAPKRIPLTRTGLSLAIQDHVRFAAAMGEAPAADVEAGTLIQYAPMVQISGLFNALQAGFEGKRLILMDKFSPATWLACVRRCRQTMLALPPAMMRMVLETDVAPGDLSSLKSVRSGAAPLDADTRRAFESRFGVPVLSVYGATEFIGPIASWSLADHATFADAKEGSVGRVWPEVASARVIDPETGLSVEAGQQGILEVLVYRVGPEWIRTNDLATLDSDGFLFIHGRADDAINRGGFKIPPDVIGNALRQHPSVFDATAVPLPDKRLGQVPAAVVELRPGAEPVNESDLMAYARSRLIAYQVPVKILIVAELPRTPAEKINRAEVYKLFEGAPDSS